MLTLLGRLIGAFYKSDMAKNVCGGIAAAKGYGQQLPGAVAS